MSPTTLENLLSQSFASAIESPQNRIEGRRHATYCLVWEQTGFGPLGPEQFSPPANGILRQLDDTRRSIIAHMWSPQ